MIEMRGRELIHRRVSTHRSPSLEGSSAGGSSGRAHPVSQPVSGSIVRGEFLPGEFRPVGRGGEPRDGDGQIDNIEDGYGVK